MNEQWTIVQHSAYGYKGNPQFKQGLETRKVNTNAEVNRVGAAGGVIFPSYREAEDTAMNWMYPPGHSGGIIPDAKGTFSDKEIDGLKIYIPLREVTG